MAGDLPVILGDSFIANILNGCSLIVNRLYGFFTAYYESNERYDMSTLSWLDLHPWLV